MGRVEFKSGSEHFSLNELLELGRRLSERKLTRMSLLDPIRQAEHQSYWRLKSAAELIGNLAGEVGKQVKAKASQAEQQLHDPSRNSARSRGRGPVARGSGEERTLPEPGTLVIRNHRFNGMRKDETYRFVVVRQPGTLLLLGDEDDFIYTNPSIAAQHATGHESVNGWDFFEISWKRVST